MKRILQITCMLSLLFSYIFAQNPKLLFTSSDISTIRNNKWNAGTFPFSDFSSALQRSNWTGSKVPNPAHEPADYDREKALWAKVLAFRYLMEININDGDDAYNYLYTSGLNGGYIYESGNYARWMTNSLALTDYCIAYDLLAGAGYFETKFGANAATKKNEVKTKLREKAAAIYGRVKNNRTGNEFIQDAVTFEPIKVLGFTVWIKAHEHPEVNEEAKFHAQIGNHRIIVASGLGVAAYLLQSDYPTESANWLAYAKKDIEHFLLNIKRYPDAGTSVVHSQNVEGAFPEGLEYLNYSAEGFIPFLIANKVNEAGTYLQNAEFKKLMDWCFDLQLPNGSAPQINSTGYNNYPVNALLSTTISGTEKYLGQLNIYKNLGLTVGLPVEAFALINSSPAVGNVTFGKITDKSVQGEVIIRNAAATPDRYLLISTKNDKARYAAELHGYADAGSYIFGTNNKILVRHPGYAGYSESVELERAYSHNTICPINTSNNLDFDSPYRGLSLPPSTDVTVTTKKSVDNFQYTKIRMELNGTLSIPPLSGLLGYVLTAGLDKTFEYQSSNWMKSEANQFTYGMANRNFLMVNDKYLIIRDDIEKSSSALKYAVSYIHGNNGDRSLADSCGGTTVNGDEVVWNSGSGPVLRANTQALGGKINMYSGLEKGIHQSPSDSALPRSKYYHAALKTACGFTDNYGQILSVLEIDQDANTKSSTVTKHNTDFDPYLIYSIDGRGKTYGRYDVVMSQKGNANVTIPRNALPFSVYTDATFLVMSFNGSDFNNVNDIKIFTNGATYVSYGPCMWVPTETGDGQTNFTVYHKAQTSITSSALASTSQRKILRIGSSLYTVYTSLDKVWLEKSTDNGTTWTIENKGKWLNTGTLAVKNPTMVVEGSYFIIAYEEVNAGSDYTNIKLIAYSTINEEPLIEAGTIPVYNPSHQDLFPVIAHKYHYLAVAYTVDNSVKITFRYSPYTGTGSFQPYTGVNYFWIKRDFSSMNTILAESFSSSKNPSFASSDNDSSFYLVWEKSNAIYYMRFTFDPIDFYYPATSGTHAVWVEDGPMDISSGNSCNMNSNPVIIRVGYGSTRVAWIGKQVISYPGYSYTAYHGVLFKDVTDTRFWYFGYHPISVNLNLWKVGGVPQGYIVGWTDDNDYAYYTRNSTLGGSIIQFKKAGTPIRGRNIQIPNGNSISHMVGIVLNTTTSPYSIQQSDNIGVLGKGDCANNIFYGREGVILKDSAQIYFAIGDITVDGQKINFVKIDDTLSIRNREVLNTCLVSESFPLTNNSHFTYGVQFGYVDSVSTASLFSSEKSVNFKVILEDVNGEQIGEFDNVTFNKNNFIPYQSQGYQVSTNGIGSKVVRLRLIVSTNFDAKYFLVERFNTVSAIGLEKNGSDLKQIGYKGTLAVTEYALSQNYPNPFNPTTTISYAIPHDGMTTLKIYDALGREVKTLVNEFKSSGRYTVKFDASKLSSGVYLYKLVSGEYSAVKKMALVK